MSNPCDNLQIAELHDLIAELEEAHPGEFDELIDNIAGAANHLEGPHY
jgi:hypothetical protein